jgi:tetratricopeptide (TPR) repeat protein
MVIDAQLSGFSAVRPFHTLRRMVDTSSNYLQSRAPTMGQPHNRGNVLFNLKRYDQALREYQAELVESPESAPAHAMIALCFTNLRRYRPARASAEEAIRCNPSYAWGHYALSWAFYADLRFTCRRPGDASRLTLSGSSPRQRFSLALRAVEEGLRLSPGSAELHLLKSMIAFDNLDAALALAEADAGLAVDPASAGCQRMRAQVLRAFGDISGSLSASGQALAREPESAASHVTAGATALAAGQFPLARRHFMEALRLDPQFPRAREGLLQALRARYWFYRPVLRAAQRITAAYYRKLRPHAIVLHVLLIASLVISLSAGFSTDTIVSGTVVCMGALLICGAGLYCAANYLLIFDPLGAVTLSRVERCISIGLLAFIANLVVLGIIAEAAGDAPWANSLAFFWASFLANLLLFTLPVAFRGRRSLIQRPS